MLPINHIKAQIVPGHDCRVDYFEALEEQKIHKVEIQWSDFVAQYRHSVNSHIIIRDSTSYKNKDLGELVVEILSSLGFVLEDLKK